MARPAKPFLHQGFWCSSFGGVPKRKLCRQEEGLKKAEIELARLQVKRHDGEPDEPPAAARKSGKLISDILTEYLDWKRTEVAPDTFESYRENLADFFERFGARSIRSITLKDGLEFKSFLMHEKLWMRGKKQMRGVGPYTVNHRIRAAKMFLTWAAKSSRQYIPRNPWDEEVGYLPEKPRERLMTDDEFSAMLDNCTNGSHEEGAQDMRELLITFRNSTLRPGEARRLKWSYIDGDRHVITFPPDVIKTRSRRRITLTDELLSVLKARRERTKGPSNGYVFPGGDGSDHNREMNPKSLAKRFRRLVDRCVKKGLIEQERSGERLVPYSHRHLRVTELVAAQLPIKVVMEEAGHKVVATTNRYTHLKPDLQTSMVRSSIKGVGLPSPETAAESKG